MSTPIENLRGKGWGPAKLAAAIAQANPASKITSQAISQWREVPAHRVLEVEAITGLSRHDLRPDIFGRAPTEAEQVA
jgi:DNA-binding transcriptional regulator YdaS (Cro superfamily)